MEPLGAPRAVRVALTSKLGDRMHVTALIDPSTERANEVLAEKRASPAARAYADTAVYPSVAAFLASVAHAPATAPHAIWIGSPPAFRGGQQAGRDVELVLTEALPQTALFVEKPVTAGPLAESQYVSEQLAARPNVVAVGYMLRYLAVVQKMKEIIRENGLTVMAINARYINAYENIVKLWWWDKTHSLGPIIEQATHFCDLMRYLGGEVNLDSVHAYTVEADEPAGRLSKAPEGESGLAADVRIPRITCATWKFENGAVGSLTHAVALHGARFATELDVYADGFSLRLVDPYNSPALYVRRPSSEDEEEYRFPDDDPFYTEAANMVDCAERGRGAAPLHSSFGDAVKTYALTWAIRLASERQR